jgi:hypothetical protein
MTNEVYSDTVKNIRFSENRQNYWDAIEAVNEAQRAHIDARDKLREAESKAKFIRAAHDPRFSHSRADYFMGKPSSVRIYIKDPKIPSGVCLAASWDFDEGTKILDAAKKAFPLSPIEGLYKSNA